MGMCAKDRKWSEGKQDIQSERKEANEEGSQSIIRTGDSLSKESINLQHFLEAYP